MVTRLRKYRVLEDWERGEVRRGEIVYGLLNCDYSLARADWRATGQEHLSVTKNPSGVANGFTITKQLLEDINPKSEVGVWRNVRALLRRSFSISNLST
jgi:hypothetical protein